VRGPRKGAVIPRARDQDRDAWRPGPRTAQPSTLNLDRPGPDPDPDKQSTCARLVDYAIMQAGNPARSIRRG
jgi:hypothetical protein